MEDGPLMVDHVGVSINIKMRDPRSEPRGITSQQPECESQGHLNVDDEN